uniref:Uncharacterized protein n=1 Tax=Manihot esculenta TaxID=3983 RepID=A0A2C9WKP5_MANES
MAYRRVVVSGSSCRWSQMSRRFTKNHWLPPHRSFCELYEASLDRGGGCCVDLEAVSLCSSGNGFPSMPDLGCILVV